MRTLSIGLLAALAALLAALPAAPVAAEEPAADPAAAYAKKVAALPAPSKEAGFRFEGVVQVNGRRMGHALFEAQPGGEGDAQWIVKDHLLLKPGGVAQVETAVAVLGRDLSLVSGTVQTNKPGDGGVAWSRTDKGFRASRTTVNGSVTEEAVRNFEHTGTALNTLAATILFLRSALPQPATYTTSIFEVEEGLDGKEAIEGVRLTVIGPQKLQGKDVLAATGSKGAKELTVLFQPESHSVVGVRLTEGDMTLEVLAADMWWRPARTAQMAAMRAGLALSTGDVALLDDVIHWPSIHGTAVKAGKAMSGGKTLSLAEYRKALLTRMAAKLPKNPGPMMRQVLLSAKRTLKEETLEAGWVRVSFPPIFKSVQLVVAEFDGVWSVVALPAAPKPAPADAPK